MVRVGVCELAAEGTEQKTAYPVAVYQAGALPNLSATFGYLVVLVDRLGRAEPTATMYRAIGERITSITFVVGLPAAVDQLRAILGAAALDERARVGAAMDRGQAVQYGKPRSDAPAANSHTHRARRTAILTSE